MKLTLIQLKKESLDSIIKSISKIKKVDYDEDLHDDIRKQEREIVLDKGKKEGEIERVTELIKNLEEGEICPTCKRALEEVDHSKEIKEEKDKLKELENLLKVVVKDFNKITKELERQSNLKSNSDEKDRLDLSKGRLR